MAAGLTAAPAFYLEKKDLLDTFILFQRTAKDGTMNYTTTATLIIALLLGLLSAGNCLAGSNNYDTDFTPAWKMKQSDWSDPAEIRRTWNEAIVSIPAGPGKVYETLMQELDRSKIPAGKRFATIIYLHGCSGVWLGTYDRTDFLARHGFAVIAPVSFARKKYPKSCDPERSRGGFYRGTLKMRQYDAEYAIVQAKTLDWVDPENVFLMGLSQGAITVATLHSEDPRARVRARIIEGWTCHAVWPEYRGLKAPAGEPVLSLVAAKDPWFRQCCQGDCGSFMNKENGSRSIVYKKGKLRRCHELLAYPQARKAVLDFLRQQMKK